jgi:hypothetical protein
LTALLVKVAAFQVLSPTAEASFTYSLGIFHLQAIYLSLLEDVCEATGDVVGLRLILCDTPYPEMIQAVREMGARMYEIRWEDGK